MFVEAAWGAALAPGPLRAFFLRVRDRRGQQIAIAATARKLAVIGWYVLTRNEPFAWDSPALTAHKLRAMELQSGMPAQHGSHKGSGSAAAYSLKSVRDHERAVAEQAEHLSTTVLKMETGAIQGIRGTNATARHTELLKMSRTGLLISSVLHTTRRISGGNAKNRVRRRIL